MADILYNMALTYQAKSELYQALKLFGMALKSYKTDMDANRSKAASVLNNLGVIHLQLGDLERARIYFRQLLVLQQHIFGREDIKMTDSLRNLGILYWTMGRGLRALVSFTKALTITKRFKGLYHIDTGELYGMVGWAWMATGNKTVARKLIGRSRAILEAVLGRDHPLSLKAASWMNVLAFRTKRKTFRPRKLGRTRKR
jgi:tetratricopeptide (TPR) repeat protein